MPVRSLTQEEAADRAALLEVEKYDVAVDLTDLPTGPAVRCTSTITFRSRTPGAETFVDCCAEVVRATLDGEPLGEAEDGRIPLRGLKEHNTLVVETVQANTHAGEGVHKAVDPADGEVYLWLSFEPDEARFVWACFDQPDLKAPHTFTVTAPGAWTVVSNSGDPVVEESGDVRVWRFPPTPPLSTYNPVVNAGPFHEIRREAGGHDLGIFARRSLAAVLERDADWIFTVTEQGLGFFGERFDMPFPQRKYDQVFLPEMGGAMENYGCVSWSDQFLRRSAPTSAELEIFAKVLLHEMAHMWFGNIVTMRWWNDLWLNEAFAEFACHWAAVSATEYVDGWASQLVTEGLDAYLADQGPISHPIHQPVHDVDEAASIFDSITYPKGAAVLNQLMTYVGEEQFSQGMAAYFARHAWGNTTLQDLMDALAEVSGRDLAAWRRGWLETAGPDRLTLEQEGSGHVLVARGPSGAGPRPHVLAVGAYRRLQDAMEPVAEVSVEVQGERTAVELPADADVFLVNDRYLTFATVRPDASSRPVLFEEAGRLPAAVSRAIAVGTVWDMLTNGEARAAEAVSALTSVLAGETSEALVEPFVRLAAYAAEEWAPDSERPGLFRQVAEKCRSLSDQPVHRTVALRGVAWTGDLDDVAWLQEVAGDDVDLQWRALVRKAELGAVDRSEVDRLLAADTDPDAWVRALTVRAAAPDADAKAEVWRVAVEERQVPIGAFGAVSRAFWRPDQDGVLAPYAEKYLAGLPKFHEGGMIPAMVLSARLFPLYGVEDDFPARAEDAARDTVPVVRKSLAERADEVARMFRSRRLG